MTRVYTNVPSMIARTNLNRNMAALETSLERLSTGFRINSGKDDPAGLIASEILRSDITGIKTAISNTERANMMIATADSALNEVANLLNDIRGLVTEAANTGAMSAEMIAANQLQVDASLDAIDRISSQTTFMGQKLLDGSLDFDITGINRNDVGGLAVHQVTFGSDKSPIDVNVAVRQAAEKASLYYNNPALADDIVLQWGGNYGYTTESFSRGTSVQLIADRVNASSNSTGVIAEVGSDAIQGSLYVSSLGSNNDIIITAGSAGLTDGDIEIKYLKGDSSGVRIEYQEPVSEGSPAKILVYLQTEAYESAVAKEVDTSPGINDNNALKFTANIPGAQYNDASIHYVDGRLTQANWGEWSDGTTGNPTQTADKPYAYYNDEATKAKALFGNINGFQNLTNFDPDEYFTIQSKAAGSAYNNTTITFLEDNAADPLVPAGRMAIARYDTNADTGEQRLRIYYNEGATVQQIQEALQLEGHFELVASDAGILSKTMDANDSYDGSYDPTQPTTIPSGYSNTNNSGGEAGTLFIALDSDPANAVTANDIVHMFDLDYIVPATGDPDTDIYSKGSERAASLFTVERTTDNDGTGTIQLYPYTIVDPITGDDIDITPKTSFDKVFKDGVTGGEVITTAAELVTALNNSSYWGMSMCPEMLAELADYNKNGTYFDVTNPPPITAKLAPGNHGLFTVSAFEEVAYYGDPNDGTGLQFLGEKDSPNIRFVADKGNDHLWIDYTTVPDKVDFAHAELTPTNANAGLVITANKKGGDYDDVQFVFKRVGEDELNVDDPDRADGWVEYDPGKSYAEAQATFKSTEGYDIANSAFYVTATERGDQYNDVKVAMTISNSQEEPVKVTFDEATKQLRVSLYSGNLAPPPAGLNPGDPGYYDQIDTNMVIAAINAADVGFEAKLSYSQNQQTAYIYDPTNDEWNQQGAAVPVASNSGLGTFEHLGLKVNQLTEIGNTGDTGGHLGGTVTVWLTDQEDATAVGGFREPNANDVARLIQNDQVVGKLFNARTYSTGQDAGTGLIDFVKDGPIVTRDGLVEKGAITVHLVTDENGLVQTTAKDLVEWWQQQTPETVSNISASIVRPAGAVWDECNDPYGYGLLAPTVSKGDCDEDIINDIQFVGWNDNVEQQTYVATFAKGTMTSDNGENSSYDLIAKRTGPDYNGYTIVYVNDSSVTGYFADNAITGSDVNVCDIDPYPGLQTNDCGEPIVPQSYTNNGMYLELDDKTKTISIHVREGITTARDIEQLIESDPYTRNLFEVTQKGNGEGVISLQDDTLLTEGGALPPGELNGAKLLFGSDASDYYLIFKSLEYGSDQFVDVQATGKNGAETSFKVYDSNGKVAEKTYGKDVDATINGIQAVGSGLDVSLNTSTLSLDFTLSESSGTNAGYGTSFSITGGGATYQIGPDVVSNQQLTIGIQSVNTVKLGGASGKLYELRSGQDADLSTDTNKAFRIIEDAIVSVATIRGRLGTMQKATFETNVNVLSDTLESLTAAESQIRDTDFAEETSNLTRAQILVQSNISTLGIANQIPNYMLGLLSR